MPSNSSILTPEFSSAALGSFSRHWRGSWIILAEELAAYVLVFVLAVCAARIVPTAVGAAAASDVYAFWYFLSTFAAATVFLLLLLKSRRGPRFAAVIFAVAIFSGVGTLAERLLGRSGAILATSASVLIYYSTRRVIIFDLVLLAGIAGIASNLGARFTSEFLAVILGILSVYDVVAVYGTRHMVSMGEALLRRHAFFAMILPERPGDFSAKVDDVMPDKGFSLLGAGDLLLPSLLVVSAARGAYADPIIIGFGALLGVVLAHFLFIRQRTRQAMPALPPVALGAIIGYAVILLRSLLYA